MMVTTVYEYIKRFPLAMIAFMVFSGCQTGEKKKKKSRYDVVDGGYVMGEECMQQTDKCWEDCFKREASITCGGCCRDQFFSCNIQEKYSFDHCKSAQ